MSRDRELYAIAGGALLPDMHQALTPSTYARAEAERQACTTPQAGQVAFVPGHNGRILARSSDRPAWLKARAAGVTATDAAKLSSERAVVQAARDKRFGSGFTGNSFTEHGRAREPHIASWVAHRFPLRASDALFHAEGEPHHLATPDGLSDDASELCEIKTTTKDLSRIPRNYLRQIWWQQYVLGAERTLFVWEEHRSFQPVGEPRYQWVTRNDDEIEVLIARANRLLELLAQPPRFR